MTKNKIEAFPFRYYYIPFIGIILTGFANIIYLTISHYRVYTDIGYKSFCAISRSLNCDTVSQSPYSIFLNVPVPVWGIFAYLFTLYIILLAGRESANRSRMWPILFWIALAFSIYSLILAGISTFIINSYCLMCILGYLVNFASLYYAWFINKRFGSKGLMRGLASDFWFLLANKQTAAPLIAGILVFSVSAPFWFPHYWEIKKPEAEVNLPQGMTEAGHPWIGAKEPELVIHEFTDYLCFQCRKMHYYLRRLLESHPEKIRLVHRHFPMDHQYNPMVKEPYHVGSGKLALISIHTKKKEKFWKTNDYFYTLGSHRESVEISTIASTLGLTKEEIGMALRNKEYLSTLFKDIKKGLELGITATPTYLINGRTYQGNIPPAVLNDALN